MLDRPQVIDPEAAVGADIAVAITVSTQVSGNRSIVMQTYISRDAPISDFHLTLDKLAVATDRQEAKQKLESLHVELAQHEKTVTAMMEDYTGIEIRNAAEWARQGKKGEPKLSANETAQKGTAKTSIERYRIEITKIKAEIAKCESVIAKVD